MTARWEWRAVRLAWGIGLICLGLAVVSLVLLAFDWQPIGGPLSVQILWFLDAVITATLGGLMASRRA